jgi:uncharacterized repeat protein (TIGR03803 family)
MVQASNGNFYGTTYTGGDGAGVSGTVFEITPAGKLTTLYSFCPNSPSCGTDGRTPRGLMQASNGNFYGTTDGGGANGHGTIFEITPAGVLTTLYSYWCLASCADAYKPRRIGSSHEWEFLRGNQNGRFLLQWRQLPRRRLWHNLRTHTCGKADNSLHVSVHRRLRTVGAGASHQWNFYGICGLGTTINDGGTIFEITPAGTLTILHTFNFRRSIPGWIGASHRWELLRDNFSWRG